MKTNDLFEEGRNCCKVARCDKAAFIIDGKRYFKALYDVMAEAQSHFIILSWDIMSQFKLVREENDYGDKPAALGEFLNAVLAENEEIEGYILNWDYSLLLASDRELMPSLRFNWNTSGRLHFKQDDHIPLGGCHHQKVVVVDDKLGFCGGIDITRGRWDTPEHLIDNPHRGEEGNRTLRPHHDIQMAVAGPIVRALSKMARERWQACGEDTIKAERSDPEEASLWPEGLPVELENVDVALSRTLPDAEGQGVYEVEQLFIDTIQQAEQYLYIENQYLSADCIAEAIEDSLAQDNGPDIIVVTPLVTDGWVSQQTMDHQRAKLIERIKSRDRYNRFQAYYPRITENNEIALNVHAKLMIADNQFVRIGSGNLSNRSMRLDSECDLSIFEKHREDVQAAIENLRNKLLAEHLGVSADSVAQAIAQHESLKSAIESIRQRNLSAGKVRTLEPLPTVSKAKSTPLPGSSDIFDPSEPIDPKRLLSAMGEEYAETQPSDEGRRLPWVWIGIACSCIALSVMWKWGPLAEWTDLATIQTTMSAIKDLPLAPLVAFFILVVACILMVPLTFLAVLSALLFGLIQGFVLALMSAMTSAYLSYLIGAWIGRESLTSLAGERFNKVSRKLAEHGVLSVAAIRLLPVAPFTIVNMVAGASHIKLKDFLLGSTLALSPALFAIVLLADQFRLSLESASFDQVMMRIGIAGLVIVVAYVAVTRAIKYVRGTDAASKA